MVARALSQNQKPRNTTERVQYGRLWRVGALESGQCPCIAVSTSVSSGNIKIQVVPIRGTS